MTVYEEKQELYRRYVNELEQYAPLPCRNTAEIREDCDYYINTPGAAWINIFDPETDKLAGFLIIGKSPEEKHFQTERSIAQAYILPKYRRRGLMTKAVKDYVSRHRTTYSLLVLKKNTYAAAFWENLFGKMGYRPMEIFEMDIMDKDDIIQYGFEPM